MYLHTGDLRERIAKLAGLRRNMRRTTDSVVHRVTAALINSRVSDRAVPCPSEAASHAGYLSVMGKESYLKETRPLGGRGMEQVPPATVQMERYMRRLSRVLW